MKTVRDGQLVWPYCPRCGCRLELLKEGEEFYFRHFEGRKAILGDIFPELVYVDARGCMCVDDVWALDDRILHQEKIKRSFL